MVIPHPPFDVELEAALDAMRGQLPDTIRPDMIQAVRGASPTPQATFDAIDAAGVQVTDHAVTSYDGAQVVVTVISGGARSEPGPGLYFIHGGGMIMGDRWRGVVPLLGWIKQFGLTVVSVEYRLAPEHPDPTPVEDAYAGLAWTDAQAEDLGIDRGSLLVMGTSAGGGLAAGVALMARDRGGPVLCGQMLICPMLDDRDATVSSRQIDGVGVWNRETNRTGWSALLGERRGGEDVTAYAAPSRATDLSNLPPTYIDCGSAEVFRDEDVAYASAIWAAGGQAELHVWPGGFHGFDALAPQSVLAQQAVEARTNWAGRIFGS